MNKLLSFKSLASVIIPTLFALGSTSALGENFKGRLSTNKIRTLDKEATEMHKEAASAVTAKRGHPIDRRIKTQKAFDKHVEVISAAENKINNTQKTGKAKNQTVSEMNQLIQKHKTMINAE